MKRNAFVETKDEAIRDALSSTAGSAVVSFLADDRVYIAILAVSGVLMIADRFGPEGTLAGIFFGFYALLLAATMISYGFLRLVRHKKYSEKENVGITAAGVWVVVSVFGSIAILVVIFTALSFLRPLRLSGVSGTINVLWWALSAIVAAYALWRIYLREKMAARDFAVLMIDGLAWLITIGGISGLAILDASYPVLLLLWNAGVRY